jgi:methionyl-tRNA formyltransferase
MKSKIKIMKINLLCDNESSWFWNTNENFINQIKKLGHTVGIYKNELNMPNGDISVFISCTKLVSNDGLKKSNSNIVCHPSDLPEGRGFAPIAWDVLKGKNKLTFTLFEANSGADEGLIYNKNTINLGGTELSDDLRKIQAEITYKMILEYISKYPSNKSFVQKGKGSWYSKRTPKDSELDINKTIKEQINLLRIVDNSSYPAFFFYKNQKFVLTINKEN